LARSGLEIGPAGAEDRLTQLDAALSPRSPTGAHPPSARLPREPHDSESARRLAELLKVDDARRFWRLRLTQPQITQVWADRGYAGELVDWTRECLWLTLRIVSRAKDEGLRCAAPLLESRAHDRLVHERPP
jgi:hypothetical protein